MELEKQVLTIEQAKHLQELGLDMSDAGICYISDPFDGKRMILPVWICNKNNDSIVYTYTLQEILNKLPKRINHDEDILCIDFCDNSICYGDSLTESGLYLSSFVHIENFGNILDAAYNTLCWVLENGYFSEVQALERSIRELTRDARYWDEKLNVDGKQFLKQK